MYTSLPYASANANWRVLCMCIVRCAWIEMHAFALHLSDQISKCRYSVSVIHGNLKPLNLQHPNGLSFPGVFDLAIYYCTCMYCIPIFMSFWFVGKWDTHTHIPYEMRRKMWEFKSFNILRSFRLFCCRVVDVDIHKTAAFSIRICCAYEKKRRICNQHTQTHAHAHIFRWCRVW